MTDPIGDMPYFIQNILIPAASTVCPKPSWFSSYTWGFIVGAFLPSALGDSCRWFYRRWKARRALCPACSGRKTMVTGWINSIDSNAPIYPIMGPCSTCKGTGRSVRQPGPIARWWARRRAQCGRCRGYGTIMTAGYTTRGGLMDCPVCHGTGKKTAPPIIPPDVKPPKFPVLLKK